MIQISQYIRTLCAAVVLGGMCVGAMCAPAVSDGRAYGVSVSDDYSSLAKTSVKFGAAKDVSDYISAADKFDALRLATSNEGDRLAAECSEAELLMAAALSGSKEMDTRLRTLVSDIRSNSIVSPGERMYVSSLYQHAIGFSDPSAASKGIVTIREQIARNLIQEFPTEAMPYVFLFNVAYDSPDAKAAKIIKDLQSYSLPASLSPQVSVLAGRLALVGTSWASVPGLAAEIPSAGTPVVVYSWSAYDSASVEFALVIEGCVPAGCRVLAINLDTDVKVAMGVASYEGLKAQQVYDALGLQGTVAKQLYLDRGGVVLIIDKRGIVQTVSGQNDLTGAFKRWCK